MNNQNAAEAGSPENPKLHTEDGKAVTLELVPAVPVMGTSASPAGPDGNPELEFHKAGKDYHHPSVEVALLSACFNLPKRLQRLAGVLSTEDFYNKHNHTALRVMLDLYHRGTPPTPANVIGGLKATVPDFGEEWIAHVNLCAAASFNPKHIAGYIRELKRATAIRGGDGYAEHKFSESFCADLFKLRMPPCKCVADKWHVYDGGTWTRTDKNTYRPLAMAVIHPFQREERRCASLLDHAESVFQVRERIFSGAYKREGDYILINVNNGTLAVDPTGAVALLEHDSSDHFTLKLPTDYIPAATCDLFQSVLHKRLTDIEDRRLLQVYSGYVLFPGCEYEAALVCYGEGKTGKSTLADAIANVVGPELCGSCGLEALCESGSYSLPTLRNKILNLGSELEGTEIATTANFKKLVSGEYLSAREIYGKPEELRTFCKLLFLTNHMPRFNGGSGAEERRLRLLHFDQIVEAEDTTLKDRMRAETPGILNWMLEGLAWLLKNKYVPDGGPKACALAREFHRKNDPVKAYVVECCILDPNGVVTTDELFEDFRDWCDAQGIPGHKMKSVFFKQLAQRFDVRSRRERYTSNVRRYVVRGIDFVQQSR